MRKEIDYRFTKELPEEIHSFKFSKYFLAVFEAIGIICHCTMLIKIIKLLINFNEPLFSLVFKNPLFGGPSVIETFGDIRTATIVCIPIFSFYYSWLSTKFLKQTKFIDEHQMEVQGIIFWLSFLATSKVMP